MLFYHAKGMSTGGSPDKKHLKQPCLCAFCNLMTTKTTWNFVLLLISSHFASNRLNIQIVIMTCFTAAWPFSHRGSLNSTILHMALRLVGCTLWWTVASLTRSCEKYTAIALFSEVQGHNLIWCWFTICFVKT